MQKGAARDSLSKIAKTRLIPLAGSMAPEFLHGTAPTKASASKADVLPALCKIAKPRGRQTSYDAILCCDF